MDLTAEFYLQTIKKVFQERQLAKGNLVHRGKKVDLSTIKQTALLVVEGEKDDISGVGQTKAALDLCTNIPNNSKQYHLQDSVGHYGVFNGSRWRNNIQPVIHDFIRKHGKKIH
jgi:poly(3-hydroxybutyrate) depolymerase